jgi:hypothetical protein
MKKKNQQSKDQTTFLFLNLLECEPDSYLEENWRKKTKDEILLIDNKLSLSTWQLTSKSEQSHIYKQTKTNF